MDRRSGRARLHQPRRPEDGPLAPDVGHAVAVRLSRRRITDEEVDRLAGIGHLDRTAGDLARAELRRLDSGPGCRLLHSLGEDQLRPDLAALLVAVSRVHAVEGSAVADQNGAERGILADRDDHPLGCSAACRACVTRRHDRHGEPYDGNKGCGKGDPPEREKLRGRHVARCHLHVVLLLMLAGTGSTNENRKGIGSERGNPLRRPARSTRTVHENAQTSGMQPIGAPQDDRE